MPELTYDRRHVTRRYKMYIKKLKTWREDVLGLINTLLEHGQEEKAKAWMILYHSLTILEDLWEKLVNEL